MTPESIVQAYIARLQRTLTAAQGENDQLRQSHAAAWATVRTVDSHLRQALIEGAPFARESAERAQRVTQTMLRDRPKVRGHSPWHMFICDARGPDGLRCHRDDHPEDPEHYDIERMESWGAPEPACRAPRYCDAPDGEQDGGVGVPGAIGRRAWSEELP